MKRSNWKTAQLASIFAMSLSLAACGSNDDDDDGGTVTPPTGEETTDGSGTGDGGDSTGDNTGDNTGDGDGDGGTGDSELNPNLETISIALDSTSTVPPANVDGATGNGSFSVDTETGALAGSVTVSGTTGQPTVAHIHNGGPGVAGPIVISLDANEDGTVWTAPEGATLDAAGIALFEAGELYVNVHTDANAPGELRSQLVDSSTATPNPGSITITLTNTAEFQPMTPPVVVLHNAPAADNGIRIFEAGQPAINEVAEIAENGNNAPLVELAGFQLDAGAASALAVGFADPANPGPLQPGESATVTLDVETSDQVMTIVSMLVCTNDGFSGIDSRPLSADATETFTAPIFDAGSESNVLSLNYWVPPCSADGMSDNITDDEGGSITAHPGQSGAENPDFDFAAGTEYLQVTITRN